MLPILLCILAGALILRSWWRACQPPPNRDLPCEDCGDWGAQQITLTFTLCPECREFREFGDKR